MGKVTELVRHVVPAVIKPIRVLWNEVIGFVFLAIAGLSIPSIIREYRKLETGGTDTFYRLLLSGLFAAVMLFFGVISFRKARKIQRS